MRRGVVGERGGISVRREILDISVVCRARRERAFVYMREDVKIGWLVDWLAGWLVDIWVCAVPAALLWRQVGQLSRARRLDTLGR